MLAADQTTQTPDVTSSTAEAAHLRARRSKTMSWSRAIRRSVLTIISFVLAIAGMATLMHAGINPQLEAIQQEGSLLGTLTKLATQL